MSDAKMTEAILQTATDLTVGVIGAYIEEDNPNGFDEGGYPIVHDLGAPTALEDAIHALTEWALNWHDLGEPPKAKNEAEYALALLHRVQDKYAPDEMRGLKYSDYLDTWLLPQCKVTVMPILAGTAPVFGFTDEDIVEMWVLVQQMRGHLPVAQDRTNG
jgi:hypothetical protein